MIEPALQGDAFLADVKTARAERDVLHLWWLGQSGFLVHWNDTHILFDPYLSDSLTIKYADTDKPHVRMTERVVAPERLDFVDVVTSSHNHTDHLDAETLTPLIESSPEMKLVIPEANRAFVAERLGIDAAAPIGLNDGDTVDVAGITFTGVPAAHERVERDEDGRCRYMGYVAKIGPYAIYHSGDTLHYDGMEDLLRPYRIDVALLPINGRKAERRVAGNLNGEEAARLAKAIDARLAIPCHYDMFEFNTESPEVFESTCKTIDQPHRVLRCGERCSTTETS